MNLRILGLAVLLAFSIPACTTQKSVIPNRYQVAQRQTVLVSTVYGQGSAVMVKRLNPQGQVRWFAWTACHVVEGVADCKIKVFVRNEGRKVGEIIYGAKVLRTSATIDIALLFVDAPPDAFFSATFAPDSPSVPGDAIYACGNFRGREFDGSISAGVISQIGVNPGSDWPWPVADQTTCPAYPGSSGGPVFNVAGEVLGITVGGFDSTLNVFVPVRAFSVLGLAWAIRGVNCPSDACGQFLSPSVPVLKPVVFDGCGGPALK